MKKTAFIPLLLIFFSGYSQVPPKKSTPIVIKYTVTYGYDCGTWGWKLGEDVIAENKDKAFVMAAYGGYSSYFYNLTADSLSMWRISFDENQILPEWGVNNLNKTTLGSSGVVLPSSTRTKIKNAVDSFAAAEPVASTGFNYKIAGNVITVNTKTKFWQAATGNYYLAAYIIEDSVYAAQHGLGNVPVGEFGEGYHLNVIRGSMSAATYGVPIASGDVAAEASFDKNFSFTVVHKSWKKDYLKAIVVLWKKNGNRFEFVNANYIPDMSTNIANPAAMTNFSIYPNPASNYITVKGLLDQKTPIKLSIINAYGQKVVDQTYQHDPGYLEQQISVDHLPGGIYFLQIEGGDGPILTRQIVVNR